MESARCGKPLPHDVPVPFFLRDLVFAVKPSRTTRHTSTPYISLLPVNLSLEFLGQSQHSSLAALQHCYRKPDVDGRRSSVLCEYPLNGLLDEHSTCFLSTHRVPLSSTEPSTMHGFTVLYDHVFSRGPRTSSIHSKRELCIQMQYLILVPPRTRP